MHRPSGITAFERQITIATRPSPRRARLLALNFEIRNPKSEISPTSLVSMPLPGAGH